MSGTNKLSKVTVGGVQKSYAYNADGTMKTDGLRGLTVAYNPLKLPNQGIVQHRHRGLHLRRP